MLAVLLYVLDVGCLAYDCCFVMVGSCWLGLCFDVAVGECLPLRSCLWLVDFVVGLIMVPDFLGSLMLCGFL